MDHEYEYPAVPPDTDDVNVTVFPTSVGFCELEMLTVGSVLTVCVMVPDVAEYPLESVMTTYTLFDPVEVKSSVHWLPDDD